MDDLDRLAENALAEASDIHNLFTTSEAKKRRPSSGAAEGGSSRAKLDMAARLKLSEDLSRRLFQKTRELEAALAAIGAAPVLARRAEDHGAIALRHEAIIAGLRRSAGTDQSVIKTLLSKVALLESASLKEKLQAVNMQLDAARRSATAAAEDYQLLSGARSDAEVARALTARLGRVAREREHEAADFDALLFQVEQRACEAYVQQKTAEHEVASHRAARANDEAAQRVLAERTVALEAEVARLRAPA